MLPLVKSAHAQFNAKRFLMKENEIPCFKNTFYLLLKANAGNACELYMKD